MEGKPKKKLEAQPPAQPRFPPNFKLVKNLGKKLVKN